MNSFLSDDAGHKSAVRLFGLLALLAGIILAFLATYLNSELGGWLATMLVGSAFAGKIVQKQIEGENNVKGTV